MTGRIFEDPGLGKILNSSRDEIQISLTLRQLDYADSFFFFFGDISTEIPATYSYPVGRKIPHLQKPDVSNLMTDNLDKSQVQVLIFPSSSIFK